MVPSLRHIYHSLCSSSSISTRLFGRTLDSWKMLLLLMVLLLGLRRPRYVELFNPLRYRYWHAGGVRKDCYSYDHSPACGCPVIPFLFPLAYNSFQSCSTSSATLVDETVETILAPVVDKEKFGVRD